jgi:hypothetical protein
MDRAVTTLADHPPRSASLTAYDRAHAATYLRLLDAAEAGAPWREVVRIVLKLDPDEDPDRLQRMHQSHLERARWMRDHGYQELAQQRPLAS